MPTKHRNPSKKQASNSCRPPKRTGCASCDTDIPKTLEGLVEHYLRSQDLPYDKNWNSMKSCLAGYQETTDFEAAVTSAIDAKDLVGKAHRQGGEIRIKRHGHQRRMERVAIDEVRRQIKSGKLEKAKSFDELYHHVFKICSNIPGIGPLYIYDAALRIGARLKLKPTRVYLHAGALDGAKALGLDTKNAPLPVTDFKPPIRKLKPHEIEDFLCIYKDKLAPFKN